MKQIIKQNTKPLTYNDLQSVKNANEFRNLLNNVLHQTLRAKGITEENAFEVIFQILLAKLYEEITILNKKEFNKELEFQILPKDNLNLQTLYDRINNLYQNARWYFFKEDLKYNVA